MDYINLFYIENCLIKIRGSLYLTNFLYFCSTMLLLAPKRLSYMSNKIRYIERLETNGMFLLHFEIFRLVRAFQTHLALQTRWPFTPRNPDVQFTVSFFCLFWEFTHNTLNNNAEFFMNIRITKHLL